MCSASGNGSTLAPPGQHPTRTRPVRLAGLLILGLSLAVACHPLRQPWDPDARMPAAFESPQATFATWVAASLAGDRARLVDCYWEGLGQAERQAYLAENLRPEAKELFSNARFLSLEPVTPVEVRFGFGSGQGAIFRGVMVRTGQGWKLQRW